MTRRISDRAEAMPQDSPIPDPDRLDQYRVHGRLVDGRRVCVRFLQPADRERIRTGFADLSAQSRHLRFMAQKSELSDEELDRLTHPDLARNVCLAVELEQLGPNPGIALGRYALDPDSDPPSAEFGLVVADRYQGLGAGTLLLRQLCAIARACGIRWLRGEMLAENRAMLALLHHLPETVCIEERDGTLEAFIDLAATPS